jgi:hypothetical protein
LCEGGQIESSYLNSGKLVGCFRLHRCARSHGSIIPKVRKSADQPLETVWLFPDVFLKATDFGSNLRLALPKIM